MRKRYVLDAWAVLALLQAEEPAARRVKELFEKATSGEAELFISVINLGEVTYRLGRVKGEDEALETLRHIRRLPLTVFPASEEAVLAAARFKMHHRLSYADAFAAAAAEALDATLVTGDPELLQLQGRIELERLERAS